MKLSQGLARLLQLVGDSILITGRQCLAQIVLARQGSAATSNKTVNQVETVATDITGFA